MKILKINSSKNTVPNSNTKKYYKAISLASLSTLALTLVLPIDVVNAVVGKPGANPPIKFYGSNGSRVITAPHSRPSIRPNTIPNTSGNSIRPNTSPITGSTNKFKPNTTPTNSTNNSFKPSIKPSTSKPTTSIGTQTNLSTSKPQGPKSPSNSKLPVQFPINDNDFDSISLGSTSSKGSNSSNGSLSVNAGSLNNKDGNKTTNKKGLSNKDKIALGAVGATVALGTTIGLAAGLAPKGNSNSGSNKDTTTPPTSVPTPSAPTYSTTGIINNPDGFLFIDEKA